MHRLHADRELMLALKEWGMMYPHPVAVAMRRLFSNRAELLGFYALAFPGYVPSGAGLSILVSDSKLVFQNTLNSLEALNEMEATRDDLPVAAFIVSPEQNAHQGPVLSRITDNVLADEKAKAKEFLRRFRGRTTDDLRTAFQGHKWNQETLCLWLSRCMALGVPPEYLNRLTNADGPYAHAYLHSWEPEAVADYYREGASTDYILRFWENSDRFDELWRQRIPYEYALEFNVHD